MVGQLVSWSVGGWSVGGWSVGGLVNSRGIEIVDAITLSLSFKQIF